MPELRAAALLCLLIPVAACSTSAPGLRIQTDDVPGGSLRVAQVVAIANRETVFDPQFEVVRKAINAAGVAGADGSVWAWGYNADGELGDGTTDNKNVPVQVLRISKATAIAASSRGSLALR
jgi:hypothetical protein